jgi:hypothetical protein
MDLYFYIHYKICRKIQLLSKFVMSNILLYISQGKVDVRSCEDRREFFYTEYIPERRSGKDRRKGI